MTPFSKLIEHNLGKDLIGVEVGVFQGKNAVYLIQDSPIKKLYLVDSYKPYYDFGSGNYTQEEMDNYHAEAIANLEPYKDRVEFIIKDSVGAAKDFKDESLDFVYIDAGHSYDEVFSDLTVWLPKVRKGGIIGGHDYGTVNGHDVKKAIDNFFKIKEIKADDPSLGLRVGEAMEWGIIKP